MYQLQFSFNFCKTLRFRLAMWNAGAVALTAAFTIIVVHQATRWAMTRSLDELLSEDTEEIRLALRDLAFDDAELRDELNRKAIGHRRHEWFVKLLAEDGSLVWGSVNAAEYKRTATSISEDVFETTGSFRHYTRSVADESSIRWICVGASIEPLAEELSHIDRIALSTWLLSLGIAPLLGWYLSGRELGPLRTMVQTASTLHPDQLSERLPIRGAKDELDQLATTVNSLLDRIAKDVGEKHDFLANAAHELRTPLAAIRTTADVALVSERSGEEYRELLGQLMEQTDDLSVIVNQLLLLSESSLPPRIENHTTFALNEIVAKSADIFRVVAESNNVSLSVYRNDGIEIVGDRDQWIQVLNNLIGNAIKYTPSGGRVSVDLRRVETEGSKPIVQLAISDTGIGIPVEDIQRIFDRFYRVDRSRTRLRDVVGTGLGLSICNAVVENHGGTIECTSQVGQGSVFTIRLPQKSA